MAVFYDDDRKKVKTVHFGATGYQDFTTNGGNEQKRIEYINRHFKNEDWEDYMTSGALSRYILWQYPQLERSINSYMKRFNLKPY